MSFSVGHAPPGAQPGIPMNPVKRLLPGIVATIALGAAMSAHGKPANEATRMESVPHLKDYPVVEFRRYVTADGELARFVKYLDAYFHEAFEQLAALVFGPFTERGPSRKSS